MEVLGFVSTAGKSAESSENGQRQRDCVCVRMVGISLYSIVTKEAATVSNVQLFALVLPVKAIYMNHCRNRSEAIVKRCVSFTR